MNILLNGEPREVESPRLDLILEHLGYGETAVATAVNGLFVARDARPTTELRDGDRLEVLAPMQGG